MEKKEKWQNYFEHIVNKYNLGLSQNHPIVIFLDGKSVTSSNFVNLNTESAGSFNEAFDKTIKYFSNKYKAIAIYGVDEVSFIFEKPKYLIEDLNLNKIKAHDIVSKFSQMFFDEFNKNMNVRKIYWHCKVSNIPKGKIKSYLKYRSTSIYELFMTYFLKRMGIKNAGKINLPEKVEMCKKYTEYENIKKFEKGHLYLNENLIDLVSYMEKGEIISLKEIKRNNTINFGLEDF